MPEEQAQLTWIRNLAGGDHSANDFANTNLTRIYPTGCKSRSEAWRADYVENEIAYYHRDALYLDADYQSAGASGSVVAYSARPDKLGGSSALTAWRGMAIIAVSLNASIQLASIDIAAQDASLTPSFHTVTPTRKSSFPKTAYMK